MQENKMKRKPENLIGVGITIGVVLSLVYYGMNVAKEHLPIKDGKDIIANYSDVLPYNLPSSIEKEINNKVNYIKKYKSYSVSSELSKVSQFEDIIEYASQHTGLSKYLLMSQTAYLNLIFFLNMFF